MNPNPRLSGLPAWTLTERYDIEAKAPASAISRNLSEPEAGNRNRELIRRLLADHFHLVMKFENTAMPVYALTVTPAGLKLQRSPITQNDCALESHQDDCRTSTPAWDIP